MKAYYIYEGNNFRSVIFDIKTKNGRENIGEGKKFKSKNGWKKYELVEKFFVRKLA